MPLFQLKKVKVKRIKSLGTIKPESRLHGLVEKNLSVFFPNLTLIKHKPVHETREFDTLAFDHETCAPVIIEYKVSRSKSVSDQVDSYWTIMMRNKELIRYKIRDVLPKLEKIDFTQAKILIIASDYSEVQINALAIRQHYVEMWRYTHYDGFLLLESVKPPKVTSISIPGGKKKKLTAKVSVYDNVNHLSQTKKTRELYEELHENIMELSSNMQCKINKSFVGYRTEGNYFAQVKLRKEFLRVRIRLSKSPKSKVIIFEKKRYYGWLRFRLGDEEQIPAAISVIEQAMKESQ